mgnify:CR=1 FL=1
MQQKMLIQIHMKQINQLIEEYMRNLKEKIGEIKTAIASSEKTYMKYSKEIQEHGQK